MFGFENGVGKIYPAVIIGASFAASSEHPNGSENLKLCDRFFATPFSADDHTPHWVLQPKTAMLRVGSYRGLCAPPTGRTISFWYTSEGLKRGVGAFVRSCAKGPRLTEGKFKGALRWGSGMREFSV